MKTSHALFSLVAAISASGACAQRASLSYTDVAPYTDKPAPAGVSTAAPRYWKGQLTRAEVQAALQQARAEGTIAAGEAIGYPYAVKTALVSPAAPVATESTSALGGAPDDGLTIDGYRFVGGEPGYVYVGHARAAR